MRLQKDGHDIKLMCRLAGGSQLYGLETPQSDFDERGVFVNTDAATILGLSRFDSLNKVSDGEDYLFHELRHYFQMLRKGNSQALEILFADSAVFTFLDERFDRLIRANSARFVDSALLFDCLAGYMEGEKRLASGARPGKEGGKRWSNIQQYGFNPSNYVQGMRLAFCGRRFFETGRFPVNLRAEAPEFRDELYDLKTRAENYRRPDVEARLDELATEMKTAFLNRQFNSVFDVELANEILQEIYLQELAEGSPRP